MDVLSQSQVQSRSRPKPRVLIVYDVEGGSKVYDAAVAIATNSWDAGSSVRVRRVGDVVAAKGTMSWPDWSAVVAEAIQVSEVHPADIGWANVLFVLSGTSKRRVSGVNLHALLASSSLDLTS